VGVRMLRDPYSSKPYVLFYTTKRVGGGIQDFDAIKTLKFGVSGHPPRPYPTPFRRAGRGGAIPKESTMPLILTTPPAAEPVSLTEAKSHLRVTHADDDAFISKLVTAARRAVEQRTGLRLVTQGLSLFLDCWPNTLAVSLAVAPVSAIADVITYGEDDTPSPYDPAHYYLDHVSHPARIVLREGRLPPRGGRPVNAIEIRFVAGYGAGEAEVPQDLKQAILLAVAHWFDRRGEGEGASLPFSALDLLDTHRIVRLA
jgi:uncharacterized phiE125 gp8 family phage protein